MAAVHTMTGGHLIGFGLLAVTSACCLAALRLMARPGGDARL
jgi:hypothetical protein